MQGVPIHKKGPPTYMQGVPTYMQSVPTYMQGVPTYAGCTYVYAGCIHIPSEILVQSLHDSQEVSPQPGGGHLLARSMYSYMIAAALRQSLNL